MATASYFHIQDCSNSQYKSSSGWTPNLADAQLLNADDPTSATYWKTVLGSLSAGNYIVIRVYQVS